MRISTWIEDSRIPLPRDEHTDSWLSDQHDGSHKRRYHGRYCILELAESPRKRRRTSPSGPPLQRR